MRVASGYAYQYRGWRTAWASNRTHTGGRSGGGGGNESTKPGGKRILPLAGLTFWQNYKRRCQVDLVIRTCIAGWPRTVASPSGKTVTFYSCLPSARS